MYHFLMLYNNYNFTQIKIATETLILDKEFGIQGNRQQNKYEQLPLTVL
jgi:hypothetical protein